MKTNPSQPLITLALFAFNQEKFIREAVRSAFAQTYSPLEIILSDDCSIDSTFEIIEDESRAYLGPHQVRVNRMENNGGLANHLNFVFDLAQGDFIVVAAGDDVCFPNKVSELIQPMLDDSRIAGVQSDVVEIDLQGQVVGIRKRMDLEGLKNLSSIVENSLAVTAQSHAFRKAVHEYFGPYIPELTNEGKVMAFRECAMGRICHISSPLTYYRIGSGVSTYRGTDVDHLTLDEPLKVASWSYSAIKQIENDAQRLPKLPEDLHLLISQRKRMLSAIYAVNREPYQLGVVFSSLIRGQGFFSVLKAFLRRNSPKLIRKLHCKMLFLRKSNRSSSMPKISKHQITGD